MGCADGLGERLEWKEVCVCVVAEVGLLKKESRREGANTGCVKQHTCESRGE